MSAIRGIPARAESSPESRHNPGPLKQIPDFFGGCAHEYTVYEDFDRCLAIDPGYQLCRGHKASALLYSGQTDEAVALQDRVLEANFHAVNENFLAHYINAGDRKTALLLAALSVNGEYAPIRYLIEAIENPGQPNSEAEAHWLRFIEQRGIDRCELGSIIVAFRWVQCFTSSKIGTHTEIWHPDAAFYRRSPAFKEQARSLMLPYWREHGFPPQCRPLENDDFECD